MAFAVRNYRLVSLEHGTLFFPSVNLVKNALGIWPGTNKRARPFFFSVRRYHQHYHSSGHIWQGRFRSFPIEADEHLLTVLRYVERNAARAKLVRRAEDWSWSSARCWLEEESRPSFLVAGPVPRPKEWLEWVNEPLTVSELEAVRECVQRGRPYGSQGWVKRTAQRLGLESSLRPRGRPPKEGKEPSSKKLSKK